MSECHGVMFGEMDMHPEKKWSSIKIKNRGGEKKHKNYTGNH